jgi:hypothetical protein
MPIADLIPALMVVAAALVLCTDAAAGSDMHGAALRIPALSPDVRARADRETVLAHDDGTPETPTTGQVGMRVAVGYQAPSWAQSVAGIEIYIMDDGVTNPIDPEEPSTWPFTVWIWKQSDTGLPGAAANQGYVPFVEPYECPEDTLVRVYLPEPVDITDQTSFPDGRFFVGIEWEYRINPYVGVDTTPPAAGSSYRWNWFEWEEVDGNVMIHAIVSGDTLCVPHVIRVDQAGGGDYLTIQEGVDAAGVCDTVLVAPGVYTGPGNRGISFHGRDVVLRAEEGRASTIIDCEHQDRGFYFVDGETSESVVRGFTVVNGSGSGGGIRCVNSWPTIRNCAFIACEGGSYGGGIYLNNAVSPSPVIRDCLIADCTSHLYGGGALMDFTEAEFRNCTFVGNGAPTGGAVACGTGAMPVFSNCILAFSSGGASAWCSGASGPAFTHCCSYGNAAGDSLCGDVGDNLYSDPLFCDVPAGDYHLRDDSPCLPDNNAWHELIGAFTGECQSSAIEQRSWSTIKAMFR